MPWDIERGHGCPTTRPWALVRRDDGTVEGCHPTEQSADRQRAALHAQEGPDMTTATETTTAPGVLHESGTLREADAGSGRAVIRIIEAGQGSSGNYPEDTLREAASEQIFHAGTPMFIDHPSMSEEYERPERSVRDLAGRLTENARYEGGALVAEAEIFPHWRPVIGGMAEHIGVSIRADGRIDEAGTVRQIVRARSVDYVTEAGAGGRIEQLVESARHADLGEARNVADWIEVEIHRGVMGLVNAMWGEGGTLTREEWSVVNDATADAMTTFRNRLAADAPHLLTRDPVRSPDSSQTSVGEASTATAPPGADTQEDTAMSESTAPADGATQNQPSTTQIGEGANVNTPDPAEPERDTQLDEALAARDQRIEALERQIAERDARQTVDRIVREAVDLPASARDRAAASVDLDADDLTEATRQALDAERTYVAEVRRSLGVGRVTGMGESNTPTETGPRTVEDYQNLGLSEADAKAAARIHA